MTPSRPVVRGIAPEWQHLTEPKFTRLVEALVRAEFAESEDSVEPVDGRGGDGGVDILVKAQGKTTVMQLKFYPEGFDGKHRDRRRHVKDSLLTALRHNAEMTDWILVVPAVPTRSGWDFVKTLQSDHPGISLRVWDRSWLDMLCGRHQGVVTSQLRNDDYFRDEMKALGAETAMLATTSDLVERVARLGRLAGEMDPDWTVDFSHRQGVTETFLRARHPQAHERSPISISMSLDFSHEDPALRQQAQRLLDYGWGGRLELPERVIRSMTIDGPEWLSRDEEGSISGFSFEPIDDGPHDWPDIRLVLTQNGRRLSSHTGAVPKVGRGTRGLTLTMQFHRHVTLTMAFPFEGTTARVDFNVACDFTGRLEVDEVRRASRMLINLNSADNIDIEVSGYGPLGRGTAIDGHFDATFVENLELMNELAEDLHVIQELLDVSFRFPGQISGVERITARGVRQMLQGKAALCPLPASFTATFREDIDAAGEPQQIRDFLAGQPGAMRLEQEPATIELFGEDLQFDSLVLWHPSVRLEGRDGAEAHIAATDGSPARMWIPARLSGDQDGRPTRWGLRGIEEPAIPEDHWYRPQS